MEGLAWGWAGWPGRDESGPGFISRMLLGQQGPPGDSRKQPACVSTQQAPSAALPSLCHPPVPWPPSCPCDRCWCGPVVISNGGVADVQDWACGLLLRPKPGSEDGVSLGHQDAPRILISCWRSPLLWSTFYTFVPTQTHYAHVPFWLVAVRPSCEPPISAAPPLAPVCFLSASSMAWCRQGSVGEVLGITRWATGLLAQRRGRRLWQVVVTRGVACNTRVCYAHNSLPVYTTLLQCTQLYNSRYKRVSCRCVDARS